MTQAYDIIGDTGNCNILVIVDHASNRVPQDIDLGIDSALLTQHIAWDIGTEAIATQLGNQAGWAAIMGGVSRLVIDLNRERDMPGVIPWESDGHAIAGNYISEDLWENRLQRYYDVYHTKIEELLLDNTPKLLLSLHSFTTSLTSRPQESRPWQVGLLYNIDDRAARIALPLLEAEGLCVGDQKPYSGKLLNATMNRHGEGNGIPYLGVEIRQDQISDSKGQAEWAVRLAKICDIVALKV